MGYMHGDDRFLLPGQYRRVGDTFDVWPIQEKYPHRIALEFDRVESIAETNPEDPGKVIAAKDSVDICPIVYERMLPLSEQLPESHLLVIDDQDDITVPEDADILRFTAFPEGATTHVHLRYLSVLKFYTLTDFLNDVRDKLQQDWTLFVVTKRIDELKGICTEEHVPFTHGLERRPGAITLVPAGRDDLLHTHYKTPISVSRCSPTVRSSPCVKRAVNDRSRNSHSISSLPSFRATTSCTWNTASGISRE